MRFFISYAHKDQARVEEIVEILKDGGYDAWYDRNLVGGEAWPQQLEDDIKQADAVIYVLSPDSAASEYCQQELDQAERFKKPILPILIIDTPIPKRIASIQYIDFRAGTPTASATSKLTRAIRNLENKPRSRWLLLAPLALSVVILTAAAILYLNQRQPTAAPMTGDFNIAVAQFDEVPSSENPTIAPVVSRQIFSALDSEYQRTKFGFDIEVRYQNSTLTSWEEAKQLAQRIHADVVIYGNIRIIPGSDRFVIDPGFYISDTFPHDLAELAGQHGLELPITLTPSDLADPMSQANNLLQGHIAILVEFTQGMAYLASGNKLELADQSFRQAISLVQDDDSFKGRELIYLLAASASRLLHKYDAARQYADEALKINPNYGRAYIAEGNIRYEEGLAQYKADDYETAQEYFSTAINYYENASKLDNQPYGSFIVEKAEGNMGSIYTIQYLIPDTLDKEALADKALSYFGSVLDSYQQSSEPGLKEIASAAYYWSGVIYQRQGDLSKAKDAFTSVLAITTNPDLIQNSQDRLKDMKQL